MTTYYKPSQLQKNLWLHQKLYQMDASYNIVNLFKVTGNLNLERFKFIVDIIFKHERIFHTRFKEDFGEICGVYDENIDIELLIIDFHKKMTNEEIKVQIIDEAEKMRKIPLNLAKGPLAVAKMYIANDHTFYYLTNFSHTITDLYSTYEIIRRIESLYNSNLTLENIKNEYITNFKNNSQMVDYLENKKILDSSDSALDFFMSELEGYERLSNEKISIQRNQDGCIKGKSEVFLLGEERAASIRKFIREQNISEFTFFAAIYAIFNRKVTNEKKFILGFPIPNRVSKKERYTIGYFANLLPMNIDMDKDITFEKLCEQISIKMISLLRYQKFDLSLLSSKGIDIHMNSVFTYYEDDITFNLKECQFEMLDIRKDSTLFESYCYCLNKDNNFLINFESGSSLKYIDKEEAFKTIVDEIIEHNKKGIKNIEILSSKSIKSLNSKTNQHKELQSNDNIVTRFERIAKQNANNIALKYQDCVMTYGELDVLSSKIAKYLSIKYPNIKSIAISLECRNHLIVGILGILKSNKSYVPIDISSPESRFEYILNSQQDILLLCEKNKEINDFSGEILVYDELMEEIKEYDNSEFSCYIDMNQIAYIIYTSGSTGKPKGVQVTHRNFISLLDATETNFKFNNKDAWTLFHSYGFDFSVWEIFGCLLTGGKLIILNPMIRKSSREFYKLLEDEKITVLNQTPTAFKSLVREEEFSKRVENKLSLRCIIFGGEALEFACLRKWVMKHPINQIELINMYGITETTVHVTYYKITDDDIVQENKSIIGKPISNLEVLIVNEDLNVLPCGCEGEILVAGEGVSKGYYKNEELTKKKFITMNVQGIEKCFYRSGDLGELREDGNIIYKGRIDNQIQLRGFRIEKGEVQSAVASLENVIQCDVDLVSFTETDKRLVAYVVLEHEELDELKMKEHLKSILPNYMIPSMIINVHTIPTTINGKVNYEILKQSIKTFDQKVDVMVNYDGLDSIENELFRMISNVVMTEEFDIEDNLFDIGVNSVHLTNLYYELKEKFDIEAFDMTDMFQYTNISSLAEHIKNLMEENPK